MSKKKEKGFNQPFDALKELKKKLEAEEAKAKSENAAGSPAPKKASAPQPKIKSTPEEDALAFHRMMSGVTPLSDRNSRVPVSATPVERGAKQKLPKRNALEEERNQVEEHLRTLVDTSGEFEVADDGTSAEGRRVDVAPDVLRKLRRGRFPIDAKLDLHGLSAGAARESLESFLREKRARGERCVLVVHGKGEHSPGGVPILRGEISAWLSQGKASHSVAAFASATTDDGGAGATYVLLRR